MTKADFLKWKSSSLGLVLPSSHLATQNQTIYFKVVV